MDCNKITTDEVDSLKIAENKILMDTGVEAPKWDNIVIMSGVASVNYKVWEKNRNGYKYDPKAWSVDNYKKNSLILWQHDWEYGGIWNALKLWHDKQDNMNILFFVDLDTLDDKSRIQVERGYVKSISTGAISKETKFEDTESWKLYTEAEAEEKFGYENVFMSYLGVNDNLIAVITNADLLENSLVTIWSNWWAVAMKDWIWTHLKKKADEYKLKYEKNNTEEEKEEEKTEQEEDKKETEVEENKDVTEKEAEEWKVEKEVEEEKTEWTKKDDTEENEPDWNKSDMVEKTIKNKFSNLSKDLDKNFVSNEKFTNEIKDLKDSLKKYQDKLDVITGENEAMWEIVTSLYSKLQNTIFDSAWTYQEEPKKIESDLYKKLKSLK